MTNLHLNEQSIARFVPSPTPSTTRLHLNDHHTNNAMNHQQHHHNTMPNSISLNHASNHLLANQQSDASLVHYSNTLPSPRGSSSQVAPPSPPVNATRVLQRNLMYVVGLPSSLAKEEILKRKDYFGKYGKIVKIAISKKTVNNKDGGNMGMGGGERALYSAYVTFKRPEDCSAAIRQINGCQLGGVIVRATYGTNKYCSFWLKGQQCNNGSCLYLHSSASDQECCSKEDLLLMDKLAKISVFIEPDDLMQGRPAINRFIRSLTPQQLIAFVQLGQSINIYQLNYLQFIIPLLAEIAKLEPDIIRLQATQTRNTTQPQSFNATPYPSHHNNNNNTANNNGNSPNTNSSLMVGVNGGQMNHSYLSVGSQQRGVTAPPGFNHNLSSIEAIGMANNSERLSPYHDAPLPASSSWSSGHNQNYPYAQRTSIHANRSPPSPPPAIGRRTNPTSAPTSASNTPYYSHLDYPRNAHYDHNTNNGNNHSNNYPSSHTSNQDYERPQVSYNNQINAGPQYFQEKDEYSVPHHQHTQSVYAQSSAMPNTDRSFNSNTTNPITINPRRATYPYPNGVSLLNENLVVDDDSERYSNTSDTNSNSSGPAPSSSSFSSTPSVSPYTNSSLSSLFQNFHLNQNEQEREKRTSDSYSLFASSAPSSTSHSPSRIIQKSVSPLSVGSAQGPVNGASLMLPPSLTSLNPHHHRLEESHLINMQLNHNSTISATLSLNAPSMSKEEENKLKQFHDEWTQQDEKNKSMNNNVINSKQDYFSVFQSASSPVIRSATSIRGSLINNNNHANSTHNTPLISYSQRLHAPAVHEQYQHQNVAKSNDHSLDASLSSIFNNVQF